ncbi:HNH endonuclease [Paenibacillus sp. HB172176]|uniref:HNH endonuclease n=1 Tax=Paenibacillus sp. HB172176 TaxID=2493690 RepID=UPI00143A6DC1|nr:HNH endonuclease [Paenibacillus sp. HB172176]
MIPTAQTFREALETLLSDARERGKEYVDVVSGELHAKVGGYPSSNHRMPTCCSVMKQQMKVSDKELFAPPKGKGAELKIRYFL